MVLVLIGAAIAGAAAYKFFGDKERHDLALEEKIFTREISESEVPPDVLKKIREKQRARLAKEDC